MQARISIFEYSDYKAYIVDWIERTPNKGRGQRKRLAEAIRCQTPFVTHVLSGPYHFSPEQAELCARWLGLNDNETEFFVVLVLKQRAGTKSLEGLFSKQISVLRGQESYLKKRLNITDGLNAQDQMTYYSSWHYSAIHMSVMIPRFQTIDAIQKYFQIPLGRVRMVVDFLAEKGLIQETKTSLKILKPVIHLERDSALMLQHHSHWRLKAIDSLQSKNTENLHYSGVMSLSQEDFEWAREKLSVLLEELLARLKHSEDQTLATLNLDWFKL